MPDDALVTVTLHLARIGKPTRTFNDILIEDDGRRLKTYNSLPAERSKALTKAFQEGKLLQARQRIYSLAKFMFYAEHFSIMQLIGRTGEVVGVYTDITTPLRRVGQEYHLTDLCLDLWLTPDGKVSVLDEDEFEQAVEQGLIDSRLARTARLTLERLLGEAEAGIFPSRYTG
jgi:predicted RNA-binding protein associated with RNAse of E/G family